MNRDFKGIWIPKEIWLAEGLTAMEKVLWAEIHSLYVEEKDGSYATNEYLAEFMGVKERTVRDALFKFRQLKLIEDVSFDGRERVIKALHPDSEFSRRLAEWRQTARQGGEIPPGRVADLRTPLIYRDTRRDTNNITPPIPPHPGSDDPMPAKAAEVREFSPEVVETAKAMKEAMVETKPDCKPPNAQKLLTSIDLLIRIDKREASRILRVFKWALADEFWRDKLFKPDPAKYLREKFDQLESKMNAKPQSFNKVDRRLRDKDGKPLIEPMKDNLF